MNRFLAFILLLFVTSLALSCGSSGTGGTSGRELQSITISQTSNGNQIQFVATGTFSGPITVTPLPVQWTFALGMPPYPYTLTAEPYVYGCTDPNPTNSGVILAYAPKGPNAPLSGSATNVVTASAALSCQ